MLASILTLALFGSVLALVADMVLRDGRKVMAALEGRSWMADPTRGRPVTIRFTPRGTATVPEQLWRPGLRAAA